MTKYIFNDMMPVDCQEDLDLFEQNITDRYSSQRLLLVLLFFYFSALSYFLYWYFN